MLLAYPKNEQDNLASSQLKILKSVVIHYKTKGTQ